ARLTALFLWTLQSTDGEIPEASVGEKDRAEEDEDDDGGETISRRNGYTLVFDVVRRFAQPLGIHLPDWEGRIIKTEKGVVRLVPVSERTRQLFGEEGVEIAANRLEPTPGGSPQLLLFPDRNEEVTVRGRGRRTLAPASPAYSVRPQ